METLVKSINSIEGNYIILFLIALFYSLERLLGTPFKFDRRLIHFSNNFLFLIAFYFANLAFAVFQVAIINWSSFNQVGLFYWIKIPFWLKVIVGVMCLDLTSYWFHRLAHTSPLLWRLHRVHHSDTTMDTSTFFRGHPLEVLVFGTSSIVACMIFGIDLPILGVYLIVQLPFLVAQHANFQLPDWTDKVFGSVFITPNIHKVHHDQNQYYTDSNFADIFVFWDKLFGTYKYTSVKSLRYGLKEFDTDKKQTFWYLIISPFMKIKRNVSDKNKTKGILFLTLALGTVVLLSCNSTTSFINGSWIIESGNNEDTSANRETLFATFLGTHDATKSILTFSSGKVVMKTSEGKEIGTADYEILENDNYLSIKFPTDKIISRYKIMDKSKKTLKLSATDDGETINLFLKRKEE